MLPIHGDSDKGKIIKIAKLAYEMNREYCRLATGEEHEPWEQAHEWQRISVVEGVLFHLRNPDADPVRSHHNWMKKRLEDGWQYGNVKDLAGKTHPCLVPYDALPIEQQVKDYLFICAVKGAIASGIIGQPQDTSKAVSVEILANQDESG